MARLELVETSLRHGQQTLLVSRLRQRHALPVAQELDACGFAALDVFGGTTFEAQLRFLGEDPFERLTTLRHAAPSTPLLASIGGQALVGHHHAPDDLVDAFIAALVRAGVDIVRLADPLNDIRNLERAIAAVQTAKRSVEGVVVYSDLPDKGDEVVLTHAAALAERGCDSICLHDPLGTLSVAAADRLVRGIIASTSLPLTLSVSAQTGQADLAYLTAVQAGVSRLDVALAPLAGGASVPAAEALVGGLRGSQWDTELDLEKVASASLVLEAALVQYSEIADSLAMRLDTSALRGLLPPSAMGHALLELRDRDALERLAEVEEEVRVVRSELGSPPFVTPLTEILATQAVYNVCDGERYLTVSQEVKDYCLGLYGKPPTPITVEVQRLVNGREEPITCRPADLLDPALPAARKEMKREGITAGEYGEVTFALFPGEYLALARGEAAIEPLGDEPVDASATAPVAEAGVEAVQDTPVAVEAVSPPEVRELTVEVDGQSYGVRVIGAAGSFGGGGASISTTLTSVAKSAVREGTVVAPMQGLILKVNVAVGDAVALGDVVAVLEAMKMQNDIVATRAGKITEVHVAQGAVVGPSDPIVQVD